MFTLSGILKVKNDTQQVSEKFKKREFVVTDASGMYPQDILFQLTQERTDQLDPITAKVIGIQRAWVQPKLPRN